MLSCYVNLDERGWGMGELGGADSLTATLNNLFSWFWFVKRQETW